MSHDDPFLKRANPHRLYRSNDRMLAGVIGGLAHYYGWNVRVSRFLAFVLTLMFFPLPLIAYIIAAVLIPRQPPGLYRDPEEEAFWRTTTLKPNYSFGEVRHRMRDLEHRLRAVEAYMTSPQYELDRQLGGHGGSR